MLGRRPAFQHGQCNTLALGPFRTFGPRDAIALLQLPLDDIKAFTDTAAAEAGVLWLLPDRFDVVARPHHILAPHLERVDVEQSCQLVDRTFHREGGLRGAIAAKPAARCHVGVDGVADALLVRAAIGRDRARHRGCQRFAAMAAVGAGVGEHLHVQRRFAIR